MSYKWALLLLMCSPILEGKCSNSPSVQSSSWTEQLKRRWSLMLQEDFPQPGNPKCFLINGYEAVSTDLFTSDEAIDKPLWRMTERKRYPCNEERKTMQDTKHFYHSIFIAYSYLYTNGLVLFWSGKKLELHTVWIKCSSLNSELHLSAVTKAINKCRHTSETLRN